MIIPVMGPITQFELHRELIVRFLRAYFRSQRHMGLNADEISWTPSPEPETNTLQTA